MVGLFPGRIIREERGKDDKAYSQLPQLVLQKLELMEKLGVSQAELRQAEKEHWAIPSVRSRTIQRLRAKKRHGEADALLRESKELVAECSMELLDLYEETG